jgi:RsiW-degrading membrane proteinase PrsW (M82 family)
MYWFAIAMSPAIALVWFFYARNAYRPESKSLIAFLFVLGGFSALIALGLNHLVEKYTQLWPGAPNPQHRMIFWFFGVGLNEEFAKLLPLLVALLPRRDFTSPYQGLLGAATVALGFAAVENLFYLERYGTLTLLLRSVLTVPAHAFFTIPMGVTLAYCKHSPSLSGKYFWMLGGLALSVFLHGLYDVWLSLEDGWWNWLAYLQVVLMGGLALALMRLRPLPNKEEPA